ncbi:MAG: nucleic acid-binding protein [Spirochaetales bacterium]|nr:nucleic acid-binding protein [Spirochaetales bacterium]
MQEVFDKLRKLQEVLSEKFEIQREMEEIPKILATKTELLNRMKKSYVENSQDHKAKSKYIDELRNRAIEAERQREGFEKQMDMIQTQREYEALDKEIRDSGEKEQDLRRDLQREEQSLGEMKVNLEKEEAMIAKQEEEVQGEQSRIKEALAEKNKALKGLERKEKTITPGLDEEILFKFERIIKSKSGLGIVPVEHGVCSGCHMILTAQYVNDVRGGDGIMFCPYCSRILFYRPEEEAPSEEEEEEVQEETPEEEDLDEEEDSGSSDDED